MKPSSHSARIPSRLSGSVHHQLNMYALAASAAGVGVLALVQPTEAKIIYTPVHRYVLLHHPLDLDLNRDGTIDFRLFRSTFFSASFDQSNTTLLARPGRGEGQDFVAGSGHYTNYSSFYVAQAYALRVGKQVGPKLNFIHLGRASGPMAGRSLVRRQFYDCWGAWNAAKNRYLGLKFEANGKFHYGWARLNESCNRKGPTGTGARALLTGYAYETIPNKPIITGKTQGPDVITVEPGSLGRLARGSAGRSEK